MNINPFYYVVYRSKKNDEEVEMYFYETIQKWNFLNLTYYNRNSKI